uniref:uncharacterized protein LOC120346007 n=1 Tax=Styela clava TaxID=7725 RepID=UPI00193A6B0D|nr:uncharacterized protein LOC120346007 [Styela clava]
MMTNVDIGSSSQSVTSSIVSVCLVSTIVFGIFSWLRKRLSVDWWRDKCCGDTESGYTSSPGMNNNPVTKFPPVVQAPPTGFANEFDDIRRSKNNQGRTNQAFEGNNGIYNNNRKYSDEENLRNAHNLSVPEINTRPPPDYYYVEHMRLSKWRNIPQDENMMDSFRSRTRSNTSDYRRTAKVISKPSITSDYVSDMEGSSDYQHHQNIMSRRPTGGRYSSRKMAEQKRRRRKHQTKATTRGSSNHKTKYATASIPSIKSKNLRKPITRSLSCTATLPEKGKSQAITSMPIPPPRSKKKRSASDAHLFITKKPFSNLKRNSSQKHSLPHDATQSQSKLDQVTRDANTVNIDQTELHQKPSINPQPIKASGLVRSETIMEVPIYVKPGRPKSYQPGSSQDSDISILHNEKNNMKKSRTKPPRTRARRDGQNAHTRRRTGTKGHERRERWQFGYGSLPADFSSKLHSSVFAEIGMTPESFVASIEKLDFEKLCRPVPNITDDQRQTSPRKPVIDKDTHGPDEQEILKNTYKLEEFGIVATDL